MLALTAATLCLSWRTATVEIRRAKLVPELLVADIAASLQFWVGLCGFSIMYSREEDGFVYLDLDGAQVMLVERRGDNGWITGPLSVPLGRGINFEIDAPSVEPFLAALANAKWPLFRNPVEQWYRGNDVKIGVREFLVQDPDGYLLRFSAKIGERRHTT
ncbi:VOC family protein [Achromobacter sp. ACM03]|uniref:bleomycin resistance protein n=1 Tax=Achromobacter sp. ACM03 TaxID=2769300 RepID=UPI001CE07E8C|nr:VOC family protein [Achromobacter sp. ACM03]